MFKVTLKDNTKEFSALDFRNNKTIKKQRRRREGIAAECDGTEFVNIDAEFEVRNPIQDGTEVCLKMVTRVGTNVVEQKDVISIGDHFRIAAQRRKIIHHDGKKKRSQYRALWDTACDF